MRSLTPLAFAAALTCGTSALAQTAQPTTPDPAPATEATVTAETSVETPAPADAGATTGVAATATADASWAQHDADQDGALGPLEFAMHVDAANTALAAEAKRERFSRAANNGAIKLLNSTADDFSKADKNQDRKVDANELAAWQAGGSTSTALTATPTTGTAPEAEATTGAGAMTPIPEATPDDSAAPPREGSSDMTPADPAAEPKQADDTMATDTPPQR